MVRKITIIIAVIAAASCLTGFRGKGAETYVELAQMMIAKGRPDIALAYFNTAINLEPRNADLYQSRGFFFLKQKQFPQALADLSTVIELNPAKTESYLSRGLVYSQLGQRELARKDYADACGMGDPSGCSFMKDEKD